MVANLGDPWIKPIPMDFRKAVQGSCHFLKFGADPSDHVQDVTVPCFQVFPMSNPLVMKHAVAQIANFLEHSLLLLSIMLLFWKTRKNGLNAARQKGSVSLIMIFEKTGPKSKMEFSDYTTWYDRMSGFADFLFCFFDFICYLVCKGKTASIIPILPVHNTGQSMMDGISQSDFTELQGGV